MTAISARFRCRQYSCETKSLMIVRLLQVKLSTLAKLRCGIQEMQLSMHWPDRMKPRLKYGRRNRQHPEWLHLPRLRLHEIGSASDAACSPRYRCSKMPPFHVQQVSS